MNGIVIANNGETATPNDLIQSTSRYVEAKKSNIMDRLHKHRITDANNNAPNTESITQPHTDSKLQNRLVDCYKETDELFEPNTKHGYLGNDFSDGGKRDNVSEFDTHELLQLVSKKYAFPAWSTSEQSSPTKHFCSSELAADSVDELDSAPQKRNSLGTVKSPQNVILRPSLLMNNEKTLVEELPTNNVAKAINECQSPQLQDNILNKSSPARQNPKKTEYDAETSEIVALPNISEVRMLNSIEKSSAHSMVRWFIALFFIFFSGRSAILECPPGCYCSRRQI